MVLRASRRRSGPVDNRDRASTVANHLGDKALAHSRHRRASLDETRLRFKRPWMGYGYGRQGRVPAHHEAGRATAAQRQAAMTTRELWMKEAYELNWGERVPARSVVRP